MKQIIPYALAMCAAVPAQAGEIVRTDAYVWHGDTVTQGEYMATAPNCVDVLGAARILHARREVLEVEKRHIVLSRT